VAPLYLACVRIGAVINPIMHIFRHRELSYILDFVETKVLLIPQRFRGFDFPPMIDELRGQLPKLAHVLVDGGEGDDSLQDVLLKRRWEDEMDAARLFAERRPDPNAVTEVIFTSGTTGQPKGAMHTHNTTISGMETTVRGLGLGADDVMLMSSPLGHNTGFLAGLLLPLIMHGKIVWQDLWEVVTAAQLIQDEGVTLSMGATPFLSDLVNNAAVERYDTSSLRMFITAGAPIPRMLVQAAAEKFRMKVISAWGMSENSLNTFCRVDDPPEKTFNTDGGPAPGVSLRILDEDGNVLPAEEEGRLQVKGPFNFVGYLKKPELNDTDEEGWFETGDNARMDADGYIRITGRSKDIIIRGGENIPVVEVENLLYRHPAIEDAAVVGMPDERLGERGCAFVTLRSGQSFSFREMLEFFAGQHLAKNYWPERLEIISELPRTPSGKVQKFKLRELAADLRPE
jgi:cyclohexanecarboxylate-CoA ligase